MAIAAELCDVTVRYRSITALNCVSLQLNEGEALAMLGPNGAGKTTAIGLLTGLCKSRQGRALLFGQNPRLPEARGLIGVTPQEASFPINMKVGELLEFVRSHYPEPKSREEIIEAFGLTNLLDRFASRMSGGQQRNFAVALAFSGNPKVVFLDEPTTGLDIEARSKIWSYVRRYRDGGGTLLLTTHYIEEAEAIAARVILLNEGEIVEDSSVEEIKRRVNVRILKLTALRPPEIATASIQNREGDRYTLIASDADAAVRELVTAGHEFSDIEVLPASLEDAISIHWAPQNLRETGDK